MLLLKFLNNTWKRNLRYKNGYEIIKQNNKNTICGVRITS